MPEWEHKLCYAYDDKPVAGDGSAAVGAGSDRPRGGRL